MQFPVLLFAQASTNSLTWTLFWAFVIALIIWWLIWLLLHDRNASSRPVPSEAGDSSHSRDESVDAASSSAGSAEQKPKEKEAAPETPMAAATAAAANAAATAKGAGSALTSPSQNSAGDQKEADTASAESPAAHAAAPPKEKESAPDDDALPKIKTASAEEAAEKFSAEIASGSARLDDAYGVVYTAAPDKPDDLKKIKGVAKVLEGKLNGHGVYQFRQIAFWTDPAVKEFSKLLTNFKDRIYRDDWIAQATKLHEEKYGEKL